MFLGYVSDTRAYQHNGHFSTGLVPGDFWEEGMLQGRFVLSVLLDIVSQLQSWYFKEFCKMWHQRITKNRQRFQSVMLLCTAVVSSLVIAVLIFFSIHSTSLVTLLILQILFGDICWYHFPLSYYLSAWVNHKSHLATLLGH